MSAFIDELLLKAKADKQTIVLPEGNDPRTLEAAQTLLKNDVADLIIVGNAADIAASGFDVTGATLVDNTTDEHREEYADALFHLREHKGMTPEKAMDLMDDVLYFGTMMVKQGHADGMVCGACHSTSDVLRAALQILKTAPGIKSVSSFFVMVVPDCEYGDNGTFLFSDCGLSRQPDAEELAHIAINSARSYSILFEGTPRVALLSHSSFGSAAQSDDRDKVTQAVEIAHTVDGTVMLDGEMQLDTAIVPEIAASKAPESEVAGKANVLVFPDLDAGNIGYKLVQRLAKAEAYGPITQGIAAPVNDLSRGCTPSDIVGVVALTCVQCQARKK